MCVGFKNCFQPRRGGAGAKAPGHIYWFEKFVGVRIFGCKISRICRIFSEKIGLLFVNERIRKKSIFFLKSNCISVEMAATSTENVIATQETQSTTPTERMMVLVGQLDDLTKTIKAIQGEMKKLQKDVGKMSKGGKGKRQPKLDANGEKIVQKTGFALPVPLSDQLCEFLSVPKGTQLSRTDVTRSLNQIIKSEKMQDPTNGRNIIPNPKLRSLLNPGEGEQISYFNLQRYLSPHFQKKGEFPLANSSTAPTSTPAPTPTKAKAATTTPRGKGKKAVA